MSELQERLHKAEKRAEGLRAMVLRKEAVLQQAQRSLHLCPNPALILTLTLTPTLTTTLTLNPNPNPHQAAKKKCTAMETEELRRLP